MEKTLFLLKMADFIHFEAEVSGTDSSEKKMNYSNLSYASDEDESSVFEFPNSQNHIEKFKNSLLPKNRRYTS